MSQYSPTGFRLMPSVVKNLLIINAIMFFGSMIVESKFDIDLTNYLGLYYSSSKMFQPYQLVTHMFMHGNFAHIFFNMFALWMFGAALENMWGGKKFFFYFFITGIGAAVVHLIIIYIRCNYLETHLTLDQIKIVYSKGHDLLLNGKNFRDIKIGSLNILTNIPTIGASGAVFGILVGFGMLFPNTELYLMFIPIPIKAKYAVLLYGVVELFLGVAQFAGDNIAHFAHLGGALVGFILIKIWQKRRFRS